MRDRLVLASSNAFIAALSASRPNSSPLLSSSLRASPQLGGAFRTLYTSNTPSTHTPISIMNTQAPLLRGLGSKAAGGRRVAVGSSKSAFSAGLSGLKAFSSTSKGKARAQWFRPEASAVEAAATAAPAAATPGSSVPPGVVPFTRTRTRIADITSSADAGVSWVGKAVTIKGWVRTLRDQKGRSFIQVNDGSTLGGLQILAEPEAEGYEEIASGLVQTGASVAVTGEVVASPGGQQKVEVKASSLKVLGTCDPVEYPLQKKRHTLEFLRGVAHLRPRTNTLGAVARVRSTLSFATHEFFQGNGFHLVHTPLISASDCEGAGEMFQVTTLLSRLDKAAEAGPAGAAQAAAGPSLAELERLKGEVSAQGSKVKVAKEGAKSAAGDAAAKAKVEAELAELLRLKERLAQAEGAHNAAAQAGKIPLLPKGGVDYSEDFFGERAYLTVSGQLNGETYACAVGDIYTFGPTFRAENSNTARHLAEFWMIEPELAFADLKDDMRCAEAYLKHSVKSVLEKNSEDVAFFDKMYEKGLEQRLRDIVDKPFATVTYTDAVAELQRAIASGHKFEFPVEWGRDLQSEHERFLTEKVFSGVPLIVTDYPKACKAFYMRENPDGRTVAAMDLLVPRVGELIGGSQREERLSVLERRITEQGMGLEPYWWYLDLRRFGSVPHAGFGLGFERMVQTVTGLENIRDVIPFPRYPGHCKF